MGQSIWTPAQGTDYQKQYTLGGFTVHEILWIWHVQVICSINVQAFIYLISISYSSTLERKKTKNTIKPQYKLSYMQCLNHNSNVGYTKLLWAFIIGVGQLCFSSYPGHRFGNGCNITDRDVKQSSTVLSILTDRRLHSLTVYSLCSDRSDNLVNTVETLGNETSTATR